MTQPSDQAPSARDRSISLAKANLYTLAISVPLVAALAGVYFALSPNADFSPQGLRAWEGVVYLMCLIAGILVHEAIHGLAWAYFGRQPLKRIRFGFHAASLAPYAHALDPLPARAYRIGAILPSIVLGVLPFAAGTLLGSFPMALFGMLFVFAAGGDLLVMWLLRGVAGDALVQDHPSRAGCLVLDPP